MGRSTTNQIWYMTTHRSSAVFWGSTTASIRSPVFCRFPSGMIRSCVWEPSQSCIAVDFMCIETWRIYIYYIYYIFLSMFGSFSCFVQRMRRISEPSPTVQLWSLMDRTYQGKQGHWVFVFVLYIYKDMCTSYQVGYLMLVDVTWCYVHIHMTNVYIYIYISIVWHDSHLIPFHKWYHTETPIYNHIYIYQVGYIYIYIYIPWHIFIICMIPPKKSYILSSRSPSPSRALRGAECQGHDGGIFRWWHMVGCLKRPVILVPNI